MQKLISLTLTLAFLFLFSNCSTTPVDENDPGALLKEAESEINSDHYIIAIDKLRVIKNKFPYSKYAIDAQLRIADVYFLQESYAEAAASYEAFKDLHPKHEKASYAVFRAAKSYYHDMPSTVARDLTTAHKAQSTYNDFLRLYPGAPEAVEAQKDLAEVRNLLAQKELYVGDFYFNRNLYDSAKPRYEKVIGLYPETDTAKSAQEKLAQIELKTKKEASSQNAESPKSTIK